MRASMINAVCIYANSFWKLNRTGRGPRRDMRLSTFSARIRSVVPPADLAGSGTRPGISCSAKKFTGPSSSLHRWSAPLVKKILLFTVRSKSLVSRATGNIFPHARNSYPNPRSDCCHLSLSQENLEKFQCVPMGNL